MNKLFTEKLTPVESALKSCERLLIFLRSARWEKAEEETRELAKQVHMIRHGMGVTK